MAGELRAVIDIGTNSVKLLVGRVEHCSVIPLYEASHQTRLGQGFYETHTLQPGAIRQTAHVVADFCKSAREHGAGSIKLIATSAARDATNKEDLLDAVHRSSGLPVIVISGAKEADLAFAGVTTDSSLGSKALLVMDVGGGSTEFILGKSGQPFYAESFPLGSVRLLEKEALEDPPTAAQFASYQRQIDRVLEEEVRPHLEPLLAPIRDSVHLVGTGGTATILARIHHAQEAFDRQQIEGTVLSQAHVSAERTRLWSLPLQQRRDIIGLPANRADVILPGVAIFERVMAVFELRALRVSTRGLRFAALLEE